MRAIAIDPALAEAHGSLAGWYDWDWSGAEREFHSALMLGPQIGLLHSWYSWFLLAMGRNEEALREAQPGLVLEPLGIEEQDHKYYILHLSKWFSVDASSPLYAPLREYHIGWVKALAQKRKK